MPCREGKIFPCSTWLSAVGSAINIQVVGGSFTAAVKLLMAVFANMATHMAIIKCPMARLIICDPACELQV